MHSSIRDRRTTLLLGTGTHQDVPPTKGEDLLNDTSAYVIRSVASGRKPLRGMCSVDCTQISVPELLTRRMFLV